MELPVGLDGEAHRLPVDHLASGRIEFAGQPLADNAELVAIAVAQQYDQADARRLGYEPSTLAYTRIYQTANGTVRGAPVTIPEIAIGPIRLTNVEASVNEHETDGSLLGMSFLGRLSGWQVSGNTLILRQ